MSTDSPSKESHSLMIPAFGKTEAISLDMSKTREGESRLIEAKTVNPVTYTDLNYAFSESYRELLKNHAAVTYQLDLAKDALKRAKSDFLIDKYPDIIKDRPKSQDSADLREAYLMREPDYVAALDRINMLKAFEVFIDGKIKVFDRVAQFMKKKMDLIIRSGLSSADLYITHGKK